MTIEGTARRRCQWQRPHFLSRPAPGVPNRAQRSGSVGERRSKGAEGGMPTHGRPDGSGLCDDEDEVAQYLGKDAFFNLKK